MMAALSMAVAAATSTVMVPPIVTGNKHRQGRFQLRRPASFDGSGTDIIGFAPAAEHKKVRLNIPLGRSPLWLKVKNPKAPAVKREAEENWGRSC
jgi:hypothetical protein